MARRVPIGRRMWQQCGISHLPYEKQMAYRLRAIGTREPTAAGAASKPLIALHMLNASDFGSGARCRVILTRSAGDRGRAVGACRAIQAGQERRSKSTCVYPARFPQIASMDGGTHPTPHHGIAMPEGYIEESGALRLQDLRAPAGSRTRGPVRF